MKCIICSNDMSYYFTKHFGVYGLDNVQYWRCPVCGFVASITHFEMSDEDWARLNVKFHNDNNAREDNPYNRNQRYFNQALMLHLMVRIGMLPSQDWLDWGSGTGSLSVQLQKMFSLKLLNFDAYIQPLIYPLSQKDLKELMGRSTLVVNTAVFEHVRSRDTLNEIESYVSNDGCLAVHTLVRGQIPNDTKWMYLLPVHCAFHTNRSMQMLMEQWNYTCSVYNEYSKMWVMFKKSPHEVNEKVAELNSTLAFEYLHFKNGFMDYWP